MSSYEGRDQSHKSGRASTLAVTERLVDMFSQHNSDYAAVYRPSEFVWHFAKARKEPAVCAFTINVSVAHCICSCDEDDAP